MFDFDLDSLQAAQTPTRLTGALVMLDPLMITWYSASGRVGDDPTRDTQYTVCLQRKEDMEEGVRAWISGGCVPLVQVSPFSARTDGSRTGVGAGAAGRSGLVGQVELRTRKCRDEREKSVVSILRAPFPAADQTLFPTGSLSDGVYVCIHTATVVYSNLIIDSYDLLCCRSSSTAHWLP